MRISDQVYSKPSPDGTPQPRNTAKGKGVWVLKMKTLAWLELRPGKSGP